MEEILTFIGVKLVEAVRMNARDARELEYKVPETFGVEEPGYEVTYPGQDRYKSWCPKDAFEEANRSVKGMPFGHAIEAARKGLKIARAGWNGKGIHVALQVPDENSKMSQEYLYLDTTGLQTQNSDAPKSLVPWLASQTDMLADDWMIVE